jgi:hypothetical protein
MSPIGKIEEITAKPLSQVRTSSHGFIHQHIRRFDANAGNTRQ